MVTSSHSPPPRDLKVARLPPVSHENEAKVGVWNRLSVSRSLDDLVLKTDQHTQPRRFARPRRKSSDNHLTPVVIERLRSSSSTDAVPPRRTMRKKGANWQAGDETMETPQMYVKRQALRHDPAVSAALDAWWAVTDSDKNGVIDRNEYIELGTAHDIIGHTFPQLRMLIKCHHAICVSRQGALPCNHRRRRRGRRTSLCHRRLECELLVKLLPARSSFWARALTAPALTQLPPSHSSRPHKAPALTKLPPSQSSRPHTHRRPSQLPSPSLTFCFPQPHFYHVTVHPQPFHHLAALPTLDSTTARESA